MNRRILGRIGSVILGIVLALSISSCLSQKDAAATEPRVTSAVYTPNEAATFDNIVVNGESLYIGLTLNDMVAEGVDIGDMDVESIAMPEFNKQIEVTFRGVPLLMLVSNPGKDGIPLGKAKVAQIHVKQQDLKDEDTVIICTVDIRSTLTEAEEKLGTPDSILCGDGFTTDGWKKPIDGKNQTVELYFSHDASNGGNSATICSSTTTE